MLWEQGAEDANLAAIINFISETQISNLWFDSFKTKFGSFYYYQNNVMTIERYT